MIYTLDGELHLQDVPTPLLHKLIRELTVPNPKYTNALRLGRPTYNIPETVMLYEIRGNALTLPRGMAEEVWREKPAGTTARDKTLKGEPLTFDTSRFTLRGYQQKAVNAALSCQWHQGVLIAPCGAGKTEIGMAVIAHLGRPALWITHTLDLAQQAKERAQLRLGLDEREVSIISGAHKRCGTKLTIATVQSLYRMELDELARTVGVVIVDECHHVVNNPEQASMFAAVLKCLPARWRFGLTASDTRSDGLSETIFQVLGPRVAVIEPQQLEQITITPRVETVPTRFVYTPRTNESPIDYVRLMRCMATDADRMQTVEGVIDPCRRRGQQLAGAGSVPRHSGTAARLRAQSGPCCRVCLRLNQKSRTHSRPLPHENRAGPHPVRHLSAGKGRTGHSLSGPPCAGNTHPQQGHRAAEHRPHPAPRTRQDRGPGH